MVEENLRAGLIKSGGSLTPFFARPICLALLVLAAASVIVPAIKWLRGRGRPQPLPAGPAAADRI
jgi:TctA family transporter